MRWYLKTQLCVVVVALVSTNVPVISSMSRTGQVFGECNRKGRFIVGRLECYLFLEKGVGFLEGHKILRRDPGNLFPANHVNIDLGNLGSLLGIQNLNQTIKYEINNDSKMTTAIACVRQHTIDDLCGFQHEERSSSFDISSSSSPSFQNQLLLTQ